MVLKHYISAIITGRRRASWLERVGLSALSYLFRAGVEARHFAYARGWMKQAKLPVCVISVGNLVVGGTGKTPVVEKLVRALQEMYRVAILTRGSSSQIEASGKSVRVASRGKLFCAVQECGDEPFCLGSQTLADVWVGKNRIVSGHKAIELGAECLILDDGMQYLELKKDIHIAVVDGKDPFSEGRFLPRGMLRDLPVRLKGVDLVVANHVENEIALRALQEKLKEVTDAPVVAMRPELLDIEAFKRQRVAVYCGIGRPERFVEALSAAGVECADILNVLDHQLATEAEWSQFVKRCRKKGIHRILCTMKDWVKLPEEMRKTFPLSPVGMELKILSGEEHWELLLKTVVDRIKR